MYGRHPSHTLDLVPVPKLPGMNIMAERMIETFVTVYIEVKEKLEKLAVKCKEATDKHH